jgi:hypothetical protein
MVTREGGPGRGSGPPCRFHGRLSVAIALNTGGAYPDVAFGITHGEQGRICGYAGLIV